MNDSDNSASFEALSALADGEASAAVVSSLTSAWRDDAAVRARWHAYQLIGDALRSDDLAAGRRDADFLRALRAKLAAEPVVLAPIAAEPAHAREAEQGTRSDAVGAGPRGPSGARAAPRSGARTLRRWAPPAAMAAGFVMVIGALGVLRSPSVSLPSEADLASTRPADVASTPALALVGPPQAAAPDDGAAREVPNSVLLRDARLDEYLAAHQQFGGSSALGVPSGFLRSATYDASDAMAPIPGAR